MRKNSTSVMLPRIPSGGITPKWVEEAVAAVERDRSVEAVGLKNKILMMSWDLGYELVAGGDPHHYTVEFKKLLTLANHLGLERLAQEEWESGKEAGEETMRMASIKKADLEMLGEAHIPSDLMTPTTGTTYGLDSFEDVQWGAGMLNSNILGEETPDPGFPTVHLASEDNMDLTDLDWLDPTQPQDLSRLPENPVDKMIPELVEAWGANRRTNGVVPTRDLTAARYEESLSSKSNGSSKRASAETIKKVLSHAMRRSAAGQDIRTITHQTMESMGEEMGRIASAMKIIRDEHGLAGNVFIRASAYPGYSSGKWSAELRKLQARYVVVSEEDLKGATWIKNGRCTYTGKIAVLEVPWKKALSHYAPKLRAIGREVPSGDPREALRHAFLTVPEAKEASTDHLPTHKAPSQNISGRSARRALESYVPEKPRVYSAKEAAEGKLREKVAARLKELVQQGVLTARVAKSLLDEKIHPVDLMKKAAQAVGRASTAKTASYSGSSSNNALDASFRMGEVREFEPVVKKQVKAAVRWLRKTMSEGWAGKNLDDLVSRRFASELLRDASDSLSQARKAHEGASGFLYVDSEAYASPTGVKGCEEGALRHRANQIPAVSSMDRCSSCAHVRDLNDGGKKCAVYNKLLLSDVSAADIARVKKANIKRANMSDVETTTSYFAEHDESFDLANSNLDDWTPYPEGEEGIQDILFGGWDLD